MPLPKRMVLTHLAPVEDPMSLDDLILDRPDTPPPWAGGPAAPVRGDSELSVSAHLRVGILVFKTRCIVDRVLTCAYLDLYVDLLC